jgi:hypothetical protein
VDEPEQPWIPGAADMPFTITLLNPHGDRHLAFDTDQGRFYRLWQYKPPEQVPASEAIRLRPSDIDQIIKTAGIWVLKHASTPHAGELFDELASGAKETLMYFALARTVTMHVPEEEAPEPRTGSTAAALDRRSA